MKKYLVIVVFALTATLLAGCASKDGPTKEQKAEELSKQLEGILKF